MSDEHTTEKDALSEHCTYMVKEVPTWHGRQDTPRSATTVATSAKTAAHAPPNTPASTCVTGTRLVERGAGSANWPRVTPPGKDQ